MAPRSALREISKQRPRWGYRRAHARLCEEGWSINRKRVQRLWREEGLRVPVRRRKRRRLGDLTVPAERLRAERPDHVWALDFQFDQTADGRVLKLLNVVDEFTRESLEMLIKRGIDADETVTALARIAATRGTPAHVRYDNGPELVAHARRDWCRFSSDELHRAGLSVVEPLRGVLPRAGARRAARRRVSSPAWPKHRSWAADWREDYNWRRPHSALAMKAPAAFAPDWAARPARSEHPAGRAPQ